MENAHPGFEERSVVGHGLELSRRWRRFPQPRLLNLVLPSAVSPLRGSMEPAEDEKNKAHPVADSEKMKLTKAKHLSRRRPRNAGQDYTESHSKTSRVRLRGGTFRRRLYRGRSPSSKKQQTALFRLRSAGPRLRYPRYASLRVCSPVEPEGFPRLCSAPTSVSSLWREGRASALGTGPAAAHTCLCLVFSDVGKTHELDSRVAVAEPALRAWI